MGSRKMAHSESNDYHNKPEISTALFLRTLALFVVLDLVVYTNVVPLVAVYLVGCVVSACSFGIILELLLTMGAAFILTYATFQLLGEPSYWRHLFAFEKAYYRILQCRDFLNIGLLICHLVCLQSTIQAMITVDKSIKAPFVGEGVGYFSLKWFARFFNYNGLEEKFGLHPTNSENSDDSGSRENEKFERGGAYMFYWAVLSACVAKLLYFNTLFTFLRAMEVFLSLKPRFDNDDDLDDTDSWKLRMSVSGTTQGNPKMNPGSTSASNPAPTKRNY